MRPQKKQRQKIKFRPLRLDDIDAEEYELVGARTNIMAIEEASRKPAFTGVLTPNAEPIFRFYMPRQGIGFLAEGVEQYEPEAFMYGLAPGYTGSEDDVEETEEVGDADEEDED